MPGMGTERKSLAIMTLVVVGPSTVGSVASVVVVMAHCVPKPQLKIGDRRAGSRMS